MTFWEELTNLITKHKELGADLDEMIADMQGEIDGLEAELKDREDEE